MTTATAARPRLAIQAPPGVPIFREEILPAGHPAALTPKEHPRCN